MKREVEEAPLSSLKEIEIEGKALQQDYIACRDRMYRYIENGTSKNKRSNNMRIKWKPFVNKWLN